MTRHVLADTPAVQIEIVAASTKSAYIAAYFRLASINFNSEAFSQIFVKAGLVESLLERPNPSNFPHHLRSDYGRLFWQDRRSRSWEGKNIRTRARKKKEKNTPQLRKLTITIKGMKLFGSVHFGTLMKSLVPWNIMAESPMNEKILKGIIIAFIPLVANPPHPQPPAPRIRRQSEGSSRMRQKKSFSEILIGLLSSNDPQGMTFIFHPSEWQKKQQRFLTNRQGYCRVVHGQIWNWLEPICVNNCVSFELFPSWWRKTECRLFFKMNWRVKWTWTFKYGGFFEISTSKDFLQICSPILTEIRASDFF